MSRIDIATAKVAWVAWNDEQGQRYDKYASSSNDSMHSHFSIRMVVDGYCSIDGVKVTVESVASLRSLQDFRRQS